MFLLLSVSPLCNIYSTLYNKSAFRTTKTLPCATPFSERKRTFSHIFFSQMQAMNKHIFQQCGSSVWVTALSLCACFDGLYPIFHVYLLVFTSSLSCGGVPVVKPDTVTVRSGMFFTRWRQGVFTSLLVLCVLSHSLWMSSNTCHMSCKNGVKAFPGSGCNCSSLHPHGLVNVVADVEWL